MVTVFSGILVLTIAVAFHEFGHFLTAKLCGVKVYTYSIGFGKKLLKKKIGETEYCVSAIPLGGYVKLAGHGENLKEPDNEPPEKLFCNKLSWQKILIVSAGPLMNYILAFVIFFSINFFFGQEKATTKIMPIPVGKTSPAISAGLQEKDIIVSINGAKVEDFDELIKALGQSRGEKANLLILRNSKEININVKPELVETVDPISGNKIKRWAIGVVPIEAAFKNPYKLIYSIRNTSLGLVGCNKIAFHGIIDMLKGKVKPKDGLGGPISIVYLSGKAAKQGFVYFLEFIAFISFALGFMNFLPIPALDGGYIVIYLLEIIFGKAFSRKAEQCSSVIGMILIIFLLIFITYIDIQRMIGILLKK